MYTSLNSTPISWNRDKAFQYLEQHWHLYKDFQSSLCEKSDFLKTHSFTSCSVSKELFSKMIILELLLDLEFDEKIKKEIIERIRRHVSLNGTFSFYEKHDLLPPDIDDTALGLTILVKTQNITYSIALESLRAILSNVNPQGVIRVFISSNATNTIDVICCVNALYFIYMMGQEALAEKTEDFIYAVLADRINHRYLYYPEGDVLLYMASRLIPGYHKFRDRFMGILKEKLLARINTSEAPLDLAYRLIASKNVGIENAIDRQKLISLQNVDGSWDADVFFQSSLDLYGSKEITTAFAIRALS